MSRTAIWAAALLLVLSARASVAEVIEKTGTFGGLQVTYKVVLPQGYDAARAYPMVLVFSGGPQTLQMANSTIDADWKTQAESRGYVVVSPVAPGGALFFEGGDKIFPEFIDFLLRTYKVKGGKMVVAGHSNGGLSAFHIAVRHPQYFTTVIGYPGLADGPDITGLTKLKDKCLFMHVGDRDEGWRGAMEEQAQMLKNTGYKIAIAVEKNQTHRLHAQEIDLERRLFEEIESCK